MASMLAGSFDSGAGSVEKLWLTDQNNKLQQQERQRREASEQEYRNLKNTLSGLYQPGIDTSNQRSSVYQDKAEASLGQLAEWMGMGTGGTGTAWGGGGGSGGGQGLMGGFSGGFDTNVPEITRDWRGMTEQDIGTSTGDRNAELARLKQKYGDVEAQYMNTENYLNTASGPEAAAAQRQLNEQIQQIQSNPNMTSAQKQRAIMQARQSASSGFLTQRQGANSQRLQSLTGLRQNQESQGQDYLNQLLGQRATGREALGQEDTRNMSAREAALQARAQQAQSKNQWAMQKLAQLQDLYKTQAGFGLDYFKTGTDQTSKYGDSLIGLNSTWNSAQKNSLGFSPSVYGQSSGGSGSDMSSLMSMMG